jgi:hypothetical protein
LIKLLRTEKGLTTVGDGNIVGIKSSGTKHDFKTTEIPIENVTGVTKLNNLNVSPDVVHVQKDTILHCTRICGLDLSKNDLDFFAEKYLKNSVDHAPGPLSYSTSIR